MITAIKSRQYTFVSAIWTVHSLYVYSTHISYHRERNGFGQTQAISRLEAAQIIRRLRSQETKEFSAK